VAQAMFATLSPPDNEDVERGDDVLGALAAFETWYAETHTGPFWHLFEVYIPETPRVDF
jgi:hypothetical protein